MKKQNTRIRKTLKKSFIKVNFFLLISPLIFYSFTVNGQSVNTWQDSSNNIVIGELIIQLENDYNANLLEQQYTHISLSPKRELSDILNIWLFTYNPQAIQADSCLNLLKQNRYIKSVQFNHYVEQNATPNDPYFTNQYGLNKIKAPDAWDITTGGTTVLNDEIVIAILDAGFDINHEDIYFRKNILEIPGNGIDDDGNGYIDDYDGWNAYNNDGIITSDDHGTHVAGITGAKGNNSKGISGVNWNVKIMPIQASSATEATVVAGYSYALKMRQLYNQTNGVKGAFIVVTNASFSAHGGDPNDYPIWCGIYDALGAEGILNINAPWNRDQELGVDFTDIPAQCTSEFLIVVTNTDQNDELYDESILNHTGSPYSKTYIDLAAPGTEIYSTLPENLYGNLTGTSMAAPFVTGAIALIYAAACEDLMINCKSNPDQVALAIKQFLYNGSDPIYDLLLKIGYGRLNVYRSILLMYQQYDLDLYITGTETTSKQYDAINTITVENYTAVGDYNVTFRAGKSIHFKHGTHLKPNPGKVMRAYIDESAFDCAIPFEPLTVNLLAPEYAYCGIAYPITCNAIVNGGHPPYQYQWYSKTETSTTWLAHDVNSPNIAFITYESFYVKVEVTDDIGITAMSPTKFVNCIDSKTHPPDTTDTLNMPIIDLTSTNTSDDKTTSLHIEQNYLRQTFNVFPNPVSGISTITFSLENPSEVTIQISDIKGKIIEKIIEIKPYDFGYHTIEYNTKNLSPGMYFYTIITNSGINALKLVILK